MKLTKQKLNQQIKEVIEEQEVSTNPGTPPGEPTTLKTVEEVKAELQGLLDDWISEQPDAQRYKDELQAVTDRIEDSMATSDVGFG